MIYQEVLRKLKAAKYEAWVVGGAPRNRLLGLPIKDYDITTSATPEQVAEVFENTNLVGAHFGVSLVKIGNESIEVATYRTDSSYSDGRRPDKVEFTRSLSADLARRDFTMNTLVMDEDGRIKEVIDGSLRDVLWFRCIACVGFAEDRFKEDHLRMLRAFRFQSELGFNMSADTMQGIEENADKIKIISKERVRMEFDRILLGEYNHLAFQLLYDLSATFHIHSALNFPPGMHLRIINILQTYKNQNLTFYLTTILWYTNIPEQVAFLTDLKYSNEIANTVMTNIEQISKFVIRSKDWDLAERIRFIRQRNLLEISNLCNALYQSKRTQLDEVMDLYLASSQQDLNPIPLLDGDDLLALGLKPGPIFKKILFDIETSQLNGEIKTCGQAIIKAKEIYDNYTGS